MRLFNIIILVFCLFVSQAQSTKNSVDVLIIGGGASGTMAGIQAARMGVSVLIVEETSWLGGMLTSAGVSAIDGNYRLRSGLWEEFRQELKKHYGGEENLKTGWVSNILFEPKVGASILKNMVRREEGVTVIYESYLEEIQKVKEGWSVKIKSINTSESIDVKIVIDATELGDVIPMVGITYDIGMDSRNDTGEEIAPIKANNIVQDLTYVAILKDYGDSVDVTITRPENYNPIPFLCTCAGECDEITIDRKLWDCDYMMKYGELPNGYYMINWPINGNDYYLNLVEMSPSKRLVELKKAKEFTLNYIYYLQTKLGYRHLGIANDMFPTIDGLPFIPYHRESRRIKGLVRFSVNDLASPFSQEYPLYRTGIAVGDYPVDHHHNAYKESHLLPELHFYPVPSYSLPLGSLIPENTKNFIVAEKSISVTNIVNGTTRLQPVCILIGQASGVLAALSVKHGISPNEVRVREVQQELLNAGAYLMPYSDIGRDDIAFNAFQRIGSSGILKGEGKNIGWENHTHIYPDSLLSAIAFKDGLKDWIDIESIDLGNELVCYYDVLRAISSIRKRLSKDSTKKLQQLRKEADLILDLYEIVIPELDDSIKRSTYAILMDELIHPLEERDIDHLGNFMPARNKFKE